MAKYNFGGGLSGEKSKIEFRQAMKFENNKLFTFKEINRDYVNFLSSVKKVIIKGVRTPKSELTFKLQPKLYVQQDKKTKQWIASDVKM